MTQALYDRRARRGRGPVPTLVLLAVAILAVVWAGASLTGPWIYTVGGAHRWLPVWQGVGELPGPGGRYRLYVRFSPSRAGRGIDLTAVQGSSTLCTPRGERLTLKLRGGGAGKAWLHMDDQPFHFRASRRPPGGSVSGDLIGPPRLEFNGRWQGANLVMDDQGSLGRAFNPDATLNPAALKWDTRAQPVPVTFAETPLGLLAPACPRATLP